MASVLYTVEMPWGPQQEEIPDAGAALAVPVTTSEAAAALAALRAAVPDVPSDAAMQRACVALVARLLGVAAP